MEGHQVIQVISGAVICHPAPLQKIDFTYQHVPTRDRGKTTNGVTNRNLTSTLIHAPTSSDVSANRSVALSYTTTQLNKIK
jgi:hypothetical protein